MRLVGLTPALPRDTLPPPSHDGAHLEGGNRGKEGIAVLSWLRKSLSRLRRWIVGTGLGNGEGIAVRKAFWQQLSAVEGFAVRFFVVVACFCFVYSLGQLANWRKWDDWKLFLDVLGILFGVIAASAAAGGFLGFLFGIPRQVRQSASLDARTVETTGSTNSTTSVQAKRFFEGNTNLEEISDWVTKIIVGLSLVEAKSILHALGTAANLFKTQALPNTQGADIVFVIIVVASACAGFLFFYLETRTRIALLFGDTEVATDSSAAFQPPIINAALSAGIVETGKSTVADQDTPRSDQAPGPAPTPEDELLLKTAYETLTSRQQIEAWASAHARAGNFEAAGRALEDAIKKNPGDTSLLLRLADIRERQGDRRAALNLLAEVRAKAKADDPELLKRELRMSLYLGGPESFEKAIPIAEQLTKLVEEKKIKDDDPYLHIWSAAAYGQRYRWLKAVGARPEESAKVREQALSAVKRAVEVTQPSSPARAFLRSLYDPVREKGPIWENDLQVFKDEGNEEIRRLLYPDDPTGPQNPGQP